MEAVLVCGDLMHHTANCSKCNLEVKWATMTDKTINILMFGSLITGILVWNKKDNAWKIICRPCLQDLAFK